MSAEDASGGVASARGVGTGRWRGGEVFSIRFAGGRHPACDAEGAPPRLRRGVLPLRVARGLPVRLCRAMEQAALRRSRRAAGWACPAGRSSRRSTSIRHPRKEAPSPCPAAFARRKGKCRTAAPPPASRRRGPCGEIPHSRPHAARPPWKTARAGIRKPPVRQSGSVRGRFWGGAGRTPGLWPPGRSPAYPALPVSISLIRGPAPPA